MRSEYINRTKKQNQSLASKQLPERVQNLLANVRRSWEAATEGVEKPVSDSWTKNFRVSPKMALFNQYNN